MTFSRITSLSTITLLLSLSVGNIAVARTCPGPNKTPHRDGTYDFTYESWVKKYDNRDHWDFGRCVENKLDKLEMYVDWKKTGVVGWAKPSDTVDITVDSPTPDADLLPTDLFYGSGLTRIDAPYRERKQTKKAGQEAVTSHIHMAIPQDSKRPAETLVSLEVEFASQVQRDAKGFRYSYRWTDAAAKDRAPVAFRWESLATLLSASGAKPPQTLRLSIEKSEVSFVSNDAPVYDITLVQFLDRNGETVVGTAPVATYHPSGVTLPPLYKNDAPR